MPHQEAKTVDIAEWVNRARHDPPRYIERQATEVFLSAMGESSPYGEKIFLKGGALMGIVYGSQRQTADIDFTTSLKPDNNIAADIRNILNKNLARASARLGYPDLICKVQTVHHKPSENSFNTASFPALEVTIAYARRGSNAAKRLHEGQCPSVLYAEISFEEPVNAIEIVRLGQHGSPLYTYSLIDLISEKLRALLQQVPRDRYRRQDIYDIAMLIEKFPLDSAEKQRILISLLDKARRHEIHPQKNAFSNPELRNRAFRDWDTMKLEIEELPDFDSSYKSVQIFYEGLPWDQLPK